MKQEITPEEKKLSLIRRYPLETIVIILVAAVGLLFRKYDAINDRVYEYMNKDVQVQTKVIEENNKVLSSVTSVLFEVKDLIKNTYFFTPKTINK